MISKKSTTADCIGTPAKIEVNSLRKNREAQAKFKIKSPVSKQVVGAFDGGMISSDSGALLLQAAEEKTGIVGAIAGCIKDRRDQSKIRHTVYDLLLQRVYQIACGYEDLNDSVTLRHDPIFKLNNGENSASGKPLASAPTLCRFENSITAVELIKIAEMFVFKFVKKHEGRRVRWITIDLDATEDETHGQQEFSFYHGYYRNYCYLPMIITACCDGAEIFEPVGAVLRSGKAHASYGTITMLKRIFRIIRKTFPDVKFMIRGDCGFAIPGIYDWLENSDENRGKTVKYVIGMPRNCRLSETGKETTLAAKAKYKKTGEKARCFGSFYYSAGSWSKKRRIIHKSEFTKQGENNRFLVTNVENMASGDIYDGLYARRGEMENRIKELKNGLKMDRTSCSSFLGNQFRVFLALAAHVLFGEIRQTLKGTELGKAQVETLRLKLLKIGAQVKEKARKIWIHFAGAFPLQDLFWRTLRRLQGELIPVGG